jgi:hypothetical protein
VPLVRVEVIAVGDAAGAEGLDQEGGFAGGDARVGAAVEDE